MRTVIGVYCILFGLLGWVGQLISAVHFELAQKLGLQEGRDGVDPILATAERNAARWDVFVLWTLAVAGILMLRNSPWWPAVALIAGAIHLDAAGREYAKLMSLKQHGLRIGTPANQTVQRVFFSLMAVTGLGIILYALRSF